MYIFGNLILQGLKGYNTWRKPNANKKKSTLKLCMTDSRQDDKN